MSGMRRGKKGMIHRWRNNSKGAWSICTWDKNEEEEEAQAPLQGQKHSAEGKWDTSQRGLPVNPGLEDQSYFSSQPETLSVIYLP